MSSEEAKVVVPPPWYSNQFQNPNSPLPPPPHPPSQWGPPSQHFPQGQASYSSSGYLPHQPPFNAGANGNNQFHPPHARPPHHPQYHQVNQVNPNWGYQQVQGQGQGHTPQANSNGEDWEVKAREWATAKKDQQSQSQSAPDAPPSGQVYHQQYHTHGYQDVHQQQVVQGVSYQQHYPVPPPTTQPERYQNYSTGNECFPGGSSAGLTHQQNLPTSSAIHQQEVPYCYSSVSGQEESGNATQHDMQISGPDGGRPVSTEQHMQYAYGNQTAAPPSNLGDQPVQFATREGSDYASVHNAWAPHAPTGVGYPPIPSSVPPIPQHDSTMAMPPVSGHIMPPYGRFPPPNLQPAGPPYPFGTKPPLHPVAPYMDDSCAPSSGPPKKAFVPPNWLVGELLKKKADLGRPPSGSFEARESIDEDVHYKPLAKVDQLDQKSVSPSKSSDEEEEDDEDEMDPARTTAINLEIKRILTEVLLKVTDELFDEIATKVIDEDEAIPKDDSIQHNHKSSAKILVSVEGANKTASSAADVLGLASYASDDDDADTDTASNADADGVETLSVESRHDVSKPISEKLSEPEAVVNAKLDLEVEVNDNSAKNSKSGLEEYSQMLGSRRKDDDAGNTKISDVSGSSGLDDDTSGSRTNHPDRTDSDKDAILDEPHRKKSGLSDDVSKDRSRTDGTKTGKEKVDSQNGSKDRMKQNDRKSAEKLKGLESSKKSTVHAKDSRDAERPHRTKSKEDHGKKREKETEKERSRHRKADDSSKDKRRRSSTSNGSSDDSTRKSRMRRRNISPSPVRSRRRRSSPSSDESSDDSRRKSSSSSRRRNRSPSPERSRRRHVSSRSPHSKHSQHKYSSHDKPRSKRSRSRSPQRRHQAK